MYTILTDSCSDLNAEVAAKFDHFEVIPLSYTISGETSFQPFDDAQRCSAFYDRLRAGETCTTSQVSPGDFVEAFKPHAEKGEAVLGLIFSSALSGTYPINCSTIMSLVRFSPTAWFTVDDLHFLKRGGRCSPSAAFFGTMLKIKPVLHVDSEGRLIARSKVRGRMQALRAIAMKFGELEADKDQMIFISHGDCEKDAMVVKETLVKEFGCDPERIILSAVGPVIGSHSGPGTVALFFRGKDRG